MLTGFNTNIKYRGEVFHVQTEDSGLRNPVITTLLYRGGVILVSKKTSYKELIPDDTVSISNVIRDRIKQLMTDQHKSMITELLAGRFDDIIKGQRSPLQEIRSASAEVPETNQPERSLNQGNGDKVLSKESDRSSSNISLTESKKDDGGINTDPQTHTPTKSHSCRSLDDILLEHIMKKKKNT
ncbi:MAG: hypothetical protein N2257_03180 [Thermodesulfovibrionales bacterium]|nr:hypothetical protein [Thermodesulfovibrionales bacterium]